MEIPVPNPRSLGPTSMPAKQADPTTTCGHCGVHFVSLDGACPACVDVATRVAEAKATSDAVRAAAASKAAALLRVAPVAPSVPKP